MTYPAPKHLVRYCPYLTVQIGGQIATYAFCEDDEKVRPGFQRNPGLSVCIL